jgi:serine phosphatase RsbU (regulator of sigma subunit)
MLPALSGQVPRQSEAPPQMGPAPIVRSRATASTKGLAIKTKIVLAMSGLACGVSLLLFLIVMLIATSTLENTIDDAGVNMLHQAEAIHRSYLAGLNDDSLIAYFTNPANYEKFDSYWSRMQADHFHERIPASRRFASWDQFRDDRFWVLIAGFALDNERALGVSNERLIQILGPEWPVVRNTPEGIPIPPPVSPRRVNMEALNDPAILQRLRPLFVKFSAGDSPNPTATMLYSAVRQHTTQRLIDLAGREGTGLRHLIFREFQREFIADLEKLTAPDESQIRYIVFEVPAQAVRGFSAAELKVVSPALGRDVSVVEAPAGEVGTVTRNPRAIVDGIPAYAFSKSLAGGHRISIYLDREQIQARERALIFSIVGVSALGIGLSILLAFLISTSITRPLELLMQDIQIISGGNFDHKPRARSNDEIGIVSRLLGDMAVGLKSAQEVWLENQGRKHDLDIAKEIQENLLPKHVPRIAGYDVSAYYSPSKEVGGDYYDFFLVDKTHLGMVCADVSGKGIPGSMVMMMTKALVSYEAQENLSPRDIFCKVNRTLAKDIKRGMFVTAFYMLLDIPTARLTVASAGHNPLLLYRAATKQCVEVNPGGIALGFDKDGRLFERNMKEEVIQLQRGDRVVIYTDGVTEAMSPGGEEFGEERMQAITIQSAGKSSAEYLTALVNAIQGHARTDDQHDDITIVTLKVG